MEKKVYPSDVLTKNLRERGIKCSCLWELKGPKNTDVAWLTAYEVNGCVVIVETFASGGWSAFTTNDTTDASKSVQDVIARTSRLVEA